MRCDTCGEHANDASRKGKYLRRTSPFGENFVGVCSPSCGFDGGTQESALLDALEANNDER